MIQPVSLHVNHTRPAVRAMVGKSQCWVPPSDEKSYLPFFLGCASVADTLSWSVSCSLRTRIFRVTEPRKAGRCSIQGASSVGTHLRRVVQASAPRPTISQPENMVRIIQARLSKIYYIFQEGVRSPLLQRWMSWWPLPAWHAGCRRVTMTGRQPTLGCCTAQAVGRPGRDFAES